MPIIPPGPPLQLIRIKIKDAEEEMNYLSRCFGHLNNKPARTTDEEKEFRQVQRKLQKVNKELEKLWSEKEIQERINAAIETVTDNDSPVIEI